MEKRFVHDDKSVKRNSDRAKRTRELQENKERLLSECVSKWLKETGRQETVNQVTVKKLKGHLDEEKIFLPESKEEKIFLFNALLLEIEFQLGRELDLEENDLIRNVVLSLGISQK